MRINIELFKIGFECNRKVGDKHALVKDMIFGLDLGLLFLFQGPFYKVINYFT